MTGRKMNWRYLEEARKGDTSVTFQTSAKFKSHYPKWKITRSLDAILEEIVALQRAQVAQTTAI